MYRLIRKNRITANSDITGSGINNQNKTVSLNKLRELLLQVKQLRHNDIYIDTTDSGEIWNCQEKCSHKIPKILDRPESGSVMSKLL